MKDKSVTRREKHKHRHGSAEPGVHRKKCHRHHRAKKEERLPSPILVSDGTSEESESESRRPKEPKSKHHNRRPHSAERRSEPKRIKQEPYSDEERKPKAYRLNRHIKDEPREDRARSRWENEDDSSNDRMERGDRGRRGRSGERLIRAMRGEGGEEEHEWGKAAAAGEGGPNGKKGPAENNAKPNFGLSGKLTEDTNMFNGVVIKYSEPAEARMPKRRWRLYPFKGDEGLPTLYIHRQSAYLIGRDRKVADLPVDHPSCSKQHAALQYRLVPYTRDDGTKGQRIRPYIIDLESANGTYVNNVRIDPRKYVELIEKDVIKFAYSSREYVLLHEHSRDDEADDNVID